MAIHMDNTPISKKNNNVHKQNNNSDNDINILKNWWHSLTAGTFLLIIINMYP